MYMYKIQVKNVILYDIITSTDFKKPQLHCLPDRMPSPPPSPLGLYTQTFTKPHIRTYLRKFSQHATFEKKGDFKIPQKRGGKKKARKIGR
jgi:hypothetical protein